MAKRYNDESFTRTLVVVLLSAIVGVACLVLGIIYHEPIMNWAKDVVKNAQMEPIGDDDELEGEQDGSDEETDDENDVETYDEATGMKVTPNASNGIRLMSAPIPANEYGANGISETVEKAYLLEAFVQPETAANKQVEWSVRWEDPSSSFASGKAVENYVNLREYVPITSYDLERNCIYVVCYQAFQGNVIVTVTTDEGGFEADCVVTYVGIPSTITVTSETLTPIAEDTYGLGVGIDYEFEIDLDNVFGVVGDKYYQRGNLVTSFGYEGKVTVGTLTSGPSGDTWADERQILVNNIASDIMDYEIDYEAHVLRFKFEKSIEGYYVTMTKDGDITTYVNKVKSIDEPCAILFNIGFTDASGAGSLRKTVKFVIDGTVVNGVEINKPSIEI